MAFAKQITETLTKKKSKGNKNTGNKNTPVTKISFKNVMAEAQKWAKENSSPWETIKAEYYKKTGKIDFLTKANYKYGPDANTEWHFVKFDNPNNNPTTKFNDLLKVSEDKPIAGKFEKTTKGELVYKLPQAQPVQSVQSVQSIQSVLNQINLSQGVNDLIKKVMLETKDQQNLSQYSWWNNSPYKQEAWSFIEKMNTDPKYLAKFVKDNGITNLKNYGWWNNNPNKVEAFKLIEEVNAESAPGSEPGTAPSVLPDQTTETPATTTTTPATTTTTPVTTPATATTSTTTPSAGTVMTDAQLAEAYAIIDKAVADGNIDAATGQVYKDMVKGWDPSKVIDMQNVKTEFENYKNKTIDPYFKEQLNFQIGTLQTAIDQQQKQQTMELEQNKTTAGQNIKQAKEGLETAGMTFTGKGIETLGAESAYAQNQGTSAIPTQTPYGGLFYEGLVPQANKLMASSTQAKYQNALTSLGQQAEQVLGSKGVAGMVPGYTPTTGNLEGTLESQKKQQYASTWNTIMSQKNALNKLNYPLTNV